MSSDGISQSLGMEASRAALFLAPISSHVSLLELDMTALIVVVRVWCLVDIPIAVKLRFAKRLQAHEFKISGVDNQGACSASKEVCKYVTYSEQRAPITGTEQRGKEGLCARPDLSSISPCTYDAGGRISRPRIGSADAPGRNTGNPTECMAPAAQARIAAQQLGTGMRGSGMSDANQRRSRTPSLPPRPARSHS